ncbi:MAG: carbon-nitrogen hydrolase family protein [Acidobacteria bacterium]|nr:carbon-nitrogen hydrolase family protein [Acidobacteriota bacterium]
MNKFVSRRGFLGAPAAMGLASASAAERLPREVWIAAIGQMGLTARNPEEMSGKMLQRMEEVLPMRPDIVCTPEVFPFAGLTVKHPPLSECAEEKTGPILDRYAEFARRNRCYVICSTYTKEKGRCYNAAVLFDRQGRYVGEYRKINPTEGELDIGVTPGPRVPPTFTTDFGKIGVQICYDINWYENWTRLGAAGAEIVFWPSAFGGGMMLNSLAWMNKCHVVSSTRFQHPTKIIDPLGTDVIETGRAGNWICGPVNLDIAVIQGVYNFVKFREIRKKYGRRFRFRILHVEALATIEGCSPDVSVPAVLKEFGIPTSREMIAASTKAQDARRPS